MFSFHSDARCGAGYSRAFSSVIAEANIVEELVGHIAAETLLAEHSHHHYILYVGWAACEAGTIHPFCKACPEGRTGPPWPFSEFRFPSAM